MKQWDPDSALSDLKEEMSVMHDGDAKATASAILTQNVAIAAQSIAHAAAHSDNERIRLDASKYIMERVLGPTKDVNPIGDNPLDALLLEAARVVSGE